MGGTTCVTSNASGITKANGSELEGKKVAVPLGTMAEYVFDESMKVVGADRGKTVSYTHLTLPTIYSV